VPGTIISAGQTHDQEQCRHSADLLSSLNLKRDLPLIGFMRMKLRHKHRV
jgi:hypothetical protein